MLQCTGGMRFETLVRVVSALVGAVAWNKGLSVRALRGRKVASG